MSLRPAYHLLLLVLGLPVTVFVFFFYLYQKKNDVYPLLLEETRETLLKTGYRERLKQEFKDQLVQKQIFFNKRIVESDIEQQADQWADEEFSKKALEDAQAAFVGEGQSRVTFRETFQSLLKRPDFLLLSFIPGILMYGLILLYNNFYLKYIFERLAMSVLVIFGVVVLVFTILYLSPFDPAANLLGESATQQQIDNFNRLYGLDQSYFAQLWNAVQGIVTFDLGSSYEGNEDVAATIASKFPVTFILTVFALLLAILIAIPVGIISATRPNSFLDYTLMFIALIGLSIPNFWQGLIFILGFSINLEWLPATYNPSNWLSMVMPVVVLGTALTASVARMTRSSMLEVVNEDYIITAKAKGLSERRVLWKHAFGNAMIPIITVIGLLFGGMLGGAAVTEKVFNISGIGSYIVDKQFIPDIPSILGGVVYIAITISVVNVIIDLLYAFIDPRIRSKMKKY
ncbi:ABC transporter permease [Planomicrobium sp. CPCC 101110]|uniref:ABC transporter permease n=1 Tax=Planomicrobium sp. CPCC 101110 TaxID=2599619 RepID=UPI0011B6D557|nr:ABC transporter permease [Planomicrobium sp. CPCC 101110]TWT25451.1 ABC transporter permease [Planomicrobium sp. CPCC 101110]